MYFRFEEYSSSAYANSMSYYFGEQRRQAPRISIILPVTLTDEENLVHIGQTNDLSNRGLGIILNSPIEERAEFQALIAFRHDSVYVNTEYPPC